MKRFIAMLALVALLLGGLSLMGCAKADVVEDQAETGSASQSSVTSIVGGGEAADPVAEDEAE